jgi:hypothetical protein
MGIVFAASVQPADCSIFLMFLFPIALEIGNVKYGTQGLALISLALTM